MSESLCQYAKSCSFYQGEEDTNGIPLTLYRNIFCRRGFKGWKGCGKYLENKLLEKKYNLKYRRKQ